jgi:hypothetical protein
LVNKLSAYLLGNSAPPLAAAAGDAQERLSTSKAVERAALALDARAMVAQLLDCSTPPPPSARARADWSADLSRRLAGGVLPTPTHRNSATLSFPPR